MIVLQLDKGQLLLPLKVTPKGGRDCVLPFSSGDTAIRLKVSSPPEDGKANAAVLGLMATVLQLPKSRLSIVQGDKSRQKRVAIADVSPEEAREIADRLSAAMLTTAETALTIQPG